MRVICINRKEEFCNSIKGLAKKATDNLEVITYLSIPEFIEDYERTQIAFERLILFNNIVTDVEDKVGLLNSLQIFLMQYCTQLEVICLCNKEDIAQIFQKVFFGTQEVVFCVNNSINSAMMVGVMYQTITYLKKTYSNLVFTTEMVTKVKEVDVKAVAKKEQQVQNKEIEKQEIGTKKKSFFDLFAKKEKQPTKQVTTIETSETKTPTKEKDNTKHSKGLFAKKSKDNGVSMPSAENISTIEKEDEYVEIPINKVENATEDYVEIPIPINEIDSIPEEYQIRNTQQESSVTEEEIPVSQKGSVSEGVDIDEKDISTESREEKQTLHENSTIDNTQDMQEQEIVTTATDNDLLKEGVVEKKVAEQRKTEKQKESKIMGFFKKNKNQDMQGGIKQPKIEQEVHTSSEEAEDLLDTQDSLFFEEDVNTEETPLILDANALVGMADAYTESNTSQVKVVEKVVEKVVTKEVPIKGNMVNGLYHQAMLNKRKLNLVITGDRRSGVTKTALELCNIMSKDMRVLYVDFDTKRHGSLFYLGLDYYIEAPKQQQIGLKLCKKPNDLDSKAWQPLKVNFRCLVSGIEGHDSVSTEQKIDVARSVLLSQRSFDAVVVDCPYDNLVYLTDFLYDSRLIVCAETSIQACYNTIEMLDCTELESRLKDRLCNAGGYALKIGDTKNKAKYIKDFESNMSYLGELMAVDTVTQDWTKMPVASGDMTSLLKYIKQLT